MGGPHYAISVDEMRRRVAARRAEEAALAAAYQRPRHEGEFIASCSSPNCLHGGNIYEGQKWSGTVKKRHDDCPG